METLLQAAWITFVQAKSDKYVEKNVFAAGSGVVGPGFFGQTGSLVRIQEIPTNVLVH